MTSRYWVVTDLVELFGRHWHEGEDPQDRIDFFKSYGYNCQVVWDDELKEFEYVK